MRGKGETMPGTIKKAAIWLGLVGSDRYPEDDVPDEEYSESVYVEPSAEDSVDVSQVTRLPDRRGGSQMHHQDYGSTGDHEVDQESLVDPQVPQTADLARIISVRPHTYNEARTIGENFRDGTPIIMNLSDMDEADAKRLVDFAAGLIFGLHGTIERVTNKVFLLSPYNVHVTAEDKQRLATSSFFNQS